MLLAIGSMDMNMIYAQSTTNALDRANNANRRGHAGIMSNKTGKLIPAPSTTTTTTQPSAPATYNAPQEPQQYYAPAYYDAPVAEQASGTVFKIELGIFKNATPTEFAELKDLGTIEIIRAVGNLSHILLGSYANMETADGVLKAVLARGYDRAIIVSRPGDAKNTYVPNASIVTTTTQPETYSTTENLGVTGGVTYGPVGPERTTFYDVAPAPTTLPATSPAIIYTPPQPQPLPQPLPQPQPVPAPAVIYERPTAPPAVITTDEAPALMSNVPTQAVMPPAPMAVAESRAYMNVIPATDGGQVTLNFTTSQTQMVYIGMYTPDGILVAEVFNGLANGSLEYKRIINTQYLFPGNYRFRLSSQTAGVLQEDLLLNK